MTATADPRVGISVIVPTLDEAEEIEPCLESVRANADADVELLVVDGGSDDDTCARVRPPARLLRATPPRSRQLNFGAGQATGDVLLFLHADCRLPTDALRQVRRSLARDDVVAGFFQVDFAPRELAARPALRWVRAGINARSRWLRSGAGDQALFVRREPFRRLGGFRELPLLEDLELLSRLRRLGRVEPSPGPVIVSGRRWRARGLARSALTMWALRVGWWLGVPPERLAPHHPPIRRHPVRRDE